MEEPCRRKMGGGVGRLSHACGSATYRVALSEHVQSHALHASEREPDGPSRERQSDIYIVAFQREQNSFWHKVSLWHTLPTLYVEDLPTVLHNTLPPYLPASTILLNDNLTYINSYGHIS
jgi:hypothetical protein